MKALLRAGGSGLVLLMIMLVGALALWIGVPLAWLYVGSQVQASTDSIGLAMLVMMVGVLVSIAVLVGLLGWLNARHNELRARSGLDDYGSTALEAVMSISATIALVGFTIWFFLFSGSSPIPLNK